jgi:hypothetical protein
MEKYCVPETMLGAKGIGLEKDNGSIVLEPGVL